MSTAQLLGYAETGTPEWFEMRRGAMTGSRIAAALGLSPWTSPGLLYYQMTGLAFEDGDSPVLEWGRRLEDVVIQKWVDDHPWLSVRREKTVWQNTERPWQVCSPDALILEPGPEAYPLEARPTSAVLEVKTSRYRDEWGEPGTDEVPVWYRAQALWMLDTLGMEYCHFGVLFAGSDYQEYCVRRDEADIDILRRGAVAFLDRVARQDRPDLDGSDSTYRLIRQMHPDIDGSAVELPADLVEQVRITQQALREADEALGAVRAEVAEFMGSSKYAFAPRGPGATRGLKVADRRSRSGGLPYVQLADITPRPHTIAERIEA